MAGDFTPQPMDLRELLHVVQTSKVSDSYKVFCSKSSSASGTIEETEERFKNKGGGANISASTSANEEQEEHSEWSQEKICKKIATDHSELPGFSLATVRREMGDKSHSHELQKKQNIVRVKVSEAQTVRVIYY